MLLGLDCSESFWRQGSELVSGLASVVISMTAMFTHNHVSFK